MTNKKKNSLNGFNINNSNVSITINSSNNLKKEAKQKSKISQKESEDLKFLFKLYSQKEYDLLLNNLPIIKPYQNKNIYSALHLYPIQIDKKNVSKDREQIFNELREASLGVNVHYIPIHTQPYYLRLGFKEGDYPNSEDYYSNAISIPLFHSMTLYSTLKLFFIIIKLVY